MVSTAARAAAGERRVARAVPGRAMETDLCHSVRGQVRCCARTPAPCRGRDNWRTSGCGVTPRLHCTHHPSSPGEIREVLLTDTCRNFKPKWWRPPRAKRARAPRQPTVSKSAGKTKPIPLGNGLFATVDAADYPELSKYRWYAAHRGSTIYAIRHEGGKEMYMHRAIMQPGRGQIVHHSDGDGLNNRRDNLVVCTRRQHQVCRGPLGEPAVRRRLLAGEPLAGASSATTARRTTSAASRTRSRRPRPATARPTSSSASSPTSTSPRTCPCYAHCTPRNAHEDTKPRRRADRDEKKERLTAKYANHAKNQDIIGTLDASRLC